MSSRYRFWIDRGGTFTDCIGLDPQGRIQIVKIPSSDGAPIEGMRSILGLAGGDPIPPCDVRMGTTLATNALLERRGVETAVAITRGFADVLAIGDQTRPEIFALRIEKPAPLARTVVEVDSRCSSEGAVLAKPDEDAVRRCLEQLVADGARSLAVVLLHSYHNSLPEKTIERWAKAAGFEHVSLSHEVASEIGLLGRGDTTVVDAYLTPLIRDYVAAFRQELSGSRLHIMQSSGGLTRAEGFRGRNAVLSGPAGGVVACAHIAAQHGFDRVIGFDMGGTSTDVSRYSGQFDRVYESRVAGVRLRAPMMNIHTVAAGGGSICRHSGGRLVVGPESAGADPGPLCYGRPGAVDLTLTDVNLALGRVLPARFPLSLDRRPVLEALARIGAETGLSAERVASGFFEVAVAHMTEAIRKISIGRGHDVRDHALIVFGGAGGQHACSVARRLGVRSLLFHPLAGVLSAFGMGIAGVSWHGEQDAGRYTLGDEWREDTSAIWDRLERSGREQLVADGHDADIEVHHRVDLRYRGTETALTLARAGTRDILRRFHAAHRERFGHARPGHPVEVVTARVEVSASTRPPEVSFRGDEIDELAPATTRLWLDGRFMDVPCLDRESLRPGTVLQGPAVILESTGTIVVEPGFRVSVAEDFTLLVQDVQTAPTPPARDTDVDPVRLEVFNNLFMSIAEQMGVILQRTALSTNIRERLDFSCALFDAQGGLIANAPHIPVHLGAMSESVRAVLDRSQPRPGDVFATNDPAGGGSHLPDVTVVSPVFDRDHKLRFFTASRGHHADIGGVTPGSMPPFSSSLEEEGVILRALRIVHDGHFDEKLVRDTLNSARYPARDPDQNVADLQAQIAANHTGAVLLDSLTERVGLDVVLAYMGHVQNNAAARVSDAIARLKPGLHKYVDHMDDGTPIGVELHIENGRMIVDFGSCGPQVEGNLNAPRAVAVAAVLYVVRCMVGESIPLNSGCLRPIEIRVPDGSVLSPSPNAAVVAGNVETSQRIVDVLLGALRLQSACQGTMNNLTFGNDAFGYYETIAGGSGAGPDFDGASGVHTHMTNTRITDPEVLEARYPVRLLRFELRRSSGGRGARRGGDGVVRELQALEPLDVSILSERRVTQPFGLDGGEPGAAGRNFHNGRPLPGKVSVRVLAGDTIRIETPGGGGFGSVAGIEDKSV